MKRGNRGFTLLEIMIIVLIIGILIGIAVPNFINARQNARRTTGNHCDLPSLFAGLPLEEPVAARGPFVMNTAQELEEGFAEYRATGERFGL